MKQKLLNTLPLILLILLIGSMAFVAFVPSAKALNNSGDLTAISILLAQLRQFFAVPLCFFWAAGLVICSFPPKLSTRLPVWVCPAVGGVMTAVGIYCSWNAVALQTFPPLPYGLGVFLMDNTWLINIWWTIAGVLLTLSILPRREPKKTFKP